MIDANGRFVPNAELRYILASTTMEKLLQPVTANPSGMSSVQQPQHKLFGEYLVIARSRSNSGNMTFKAIATRLVL